MAETLDPAFGEEHHLCSLNYPETENSSEKVVSFLNQELRPRHKHSISQEFPALFGHYPGGQSLYIEKDGVVVSHVGMVVREFQHPHFRLRVGLIGSVATAHPFRGLGMASTLLRHAITELKRKGSVVALLWSDHSDFYLPLGFHRTGRETDFRFSPDHFVEGDLTPRPMNLDKDIEAIWRLYQRHSAKVDRSLEEMKRLCRIPETKIYVTERAGALTSYIAINKGADFTDYIHEWGGDLADLQKNISYCQKQFYPQKPLTLIAPSDYELGPINEIAVEKWNGVLGLVKILDRQRLISIYSDYLRKLQCDFKWDREKESIEIGGNIISTKTDPELLRLVFGAGIEAAYPVLPLFLWGFDSI